MRSAATSNASRCCSLNCESRVFSHSWLALRSASINSAPRGDTETKTCRPSAGCALRATNPSSASEAITRVIEGGLTRSRRANAPGVMAPSFARVDSADNCDSDIGDSVRRNLNWRANRITARDRSLANRESTSFTLQRIASASSRAQQNRTGEPTQSRRPSVSPLAAPRIGHRLGWDRWTPNRLPPLSRNRLRCPGSCSNRGRSSSSSRSAGWLPSSSPSQFPHYTSGVRSRLPDWVSAHSARRFFSFSGAPLGAARGAPNAA